MEEKRPESAATSQAAGKAVYLYGFARAGMQPEVPSVGLDGAGVVSWLEQGRVAAIYCFVSPGDFTGETGEAHLQDPSWVVPRACRHEEVVECAMGASPVFPVRFGAVFSSLKALSAVLAEQSAEISSFLDRVAGKEEWSVKCCMDVSKAAEALLESDPDLLARRLALPEQPGARYFQEKRLKADARQLAADACAEATEEVNAALEALTRGVVRPGRAALVRRGARRRDGPPAGVPARPPRRRRLPPAGRRHRRRFRRERPRPGDLGSVATLQLLQIPGGSAGMKHLVYCILSGDDLPREDLPAGVDGGKVCLAREGGLAAAFSLAEEGGRALDVFRAREYAAVVDAFHRSCTVLPMRYGCFFASEERTSRCWAKGATSSARSWTT